MTEDQEAARRAALEARRAAAPPRSASFLTPPAAPATGSPFATIASGQRPEPPEPPQAPESPGPVEPPQALAAPLEAPRESDPNLLRRFAAEPMGAPVPVVPPIATGLLTTAANPATSFAAAAPPRTPEPPAYSQPAYSQPAYSQPAPPTPPNTAAIEAYHRFAREGSVSEVTDYYRGPQALVIEAPPPPVLIAESLIPTGKPRLAPQPDKPRGPKIAAALVVLAVAGGVGYYVTQHKPAPAPRPVVMPTIVDQSGATTPGVLDVVAAATAGAPYLVTVPSGWSAQSSPTRPGGSHIDVTMTQQVLHFTVTVRSSPAGEPEVRPPGRDTRVALRIFGHPAGVEALELPSAPDTKTRLATVTRDGVRYAVTITVPLATANQDFPRAAVAVAGFKDTP